MAAATSSLARVARRVRAGDWRAPGSRSDGRPLGSAITRRAVPGRPPVSSSQSRMSFAYHARRRWPLASSCSSRSNRLGHVPNVDRHGGAEPVGQAATAPTTRPETRRTLTPSPLSLRDGWGGSLDVLHLDVTARANMVRANRDSQGPRGSDGPIRSPGPYGPSRRAFPTIDAAVIGPQNRLSSDSPRLSPST